MGWKSDLRPLLVPRSIVSGLCDDGTCQRPFGLSARMKARFVLQTGRREKIQ
jgi:hypothetical protein